jgi:pilus assembly protein CpaF
MTDYTPPPSGPGPLGLLLARADVEEIHVEGSDATMLRLASGELVPGPPIASTDGELEQLLCSLGLHTDDGPAQGEDR